MVSRAKSGPEQGALQEEFLCNNLINYVGERKKLSFRSRRTVNMKTRITKNENGNSVTVFAR
jgi:hypothetical protein